MYHPYSLPKIYTHIPKPKKRIPKTILLLFFMLNVIIGYDFGFLKILHKSLQPLAKIISLSFTLIWAFVLTTPLYNFVGDFYWYTLNFIQYVCYVAVLKFTKYTFYDFTIGILSVDESMTRVSKERTGVITWIQFLLVYISKFAILYSYCLMFSDECDTDFLPLYIYGIPGMGIDLVSLILILTYYYIYCCVKNLNELLKEGTDIQILKKRYMATADCYENIKPLYSRLLFIVLLFEIPLMMGMMWNMLRNIKLQRGWFTYLGEYIFAFHIMSQITYSAVVVQMVRSQIHTLTVKLHNILIDEHDAKKHDEISRLLQLMSVRRLRHDVIGVVPTDMRLPVSVISLCVTYVIVTVQFTHLYD